MLSCLRGIIGPPPSANPRDYDNDSKSTLVQEGNEKSEKVSISHIDQKPLVKSTLFKNVKLVGLEDKGLQDVLVKDGKVARTGQTLEKVADSSDLEVVDFQGQWLGPSMIDWHVHSKLAAHYNHRVHLEGEKSAKNVFARMKAALNDPVFDREDLIGVDMRNGDWPDNDQMNRINLDKYVSSTRPIFLFYNGYHSMVCNSYGLEKYGMKAEGTGILYEQAAWPLTHQLGKIDDKEMDAWIDAWAKNAAELGITEIVDLEIDFNIRDWKRRCINGFDRLRVNLGIYEPHFEDAVKQGFKTGDVVPQTDGLITIGPFKMVTDGGLGSQTACCHDPYPNTDDYGMMNESPEKIKVWTRKATEHGFRLAIHAIGDQANTTCLTTMATNPIPPLPGSTIEHAQLLVLDDIPMFKQLDLIASVQPKHLVDDRETCLTYWPGREHRAWALKSLADAGVKMKFGSDNPVAEMNPWEAMAVAMSRRRAGGLPLSEEQAVDAYTSWVSSTSNGKASIEVGDRADFVLIDKDPLKCDAAGMRNLTVLATVLGGRFTYRK
ncbi:uncharacterized protein I303_104880 [Kwoniella dejecticola CBS 10117]|uniref:Amidohydrolase 3 domain-containing protein n=1 Tax=Kwoniella dejecticola CBS 10117 TaxID=1296121 RepID=A0A1A6A427_9TREE|nr:uncharacterized protein I303_04136 [Kwoniella dejecticola CBS 10117]OBR84815.1 hypothetical protein I303_04136 [Kwoniella dejecticola CBS 10117]